LYSFLNYKLVYNLIVKKPKLILISLAQAVSVFAYILFVVEIITTMGNLFPNDKPGPLQPLAFLLLFVISAAITGFLVLGKSITLYLDNLKKEAVELFGYTITWLALIAAAVFVILANLR